MVRRKKASKTRYAPRLKQPRMKVVHCRLPDHIYAALSQASDGNSWTISAEVVYRLEQSFATPATPTQAFFAVVAHAIDGLRLSKHLPPPDDPQNTRTQRAYEERERARGTWLRDAYLSREAHRAVERALELVAPTKDLPVSEHPDFAEGDFATPDGRSQFEAWWHEVRCCDPEAKIDDTRPRKAHHQRRLAMLRVGVKSLVDKVKLGDKTGKDAQKTRRGWQAFTVAEYKLFRRLAIIRIKTGLTEEQHKRFVELFKKAPSQEQQKYQLGDLDNPGPFGLKAIPDTKVDPRSPLPVPKEQLDHTARNDEDRESDDDLGVPS
jgi:hypothetical protein